MRIMSRILPIPEGYQVTLVDRMPFHGLKPEFYALAAGTKSDKDVRMQFPDNKQINTVYGEINDIDLEEQIISVGNSKIDYDELIIGLVVKINTIMFLALKNIHIAFKHYLNHVKPFIVSVNYLPVRV